MSSFYRLFQILDLIGVVSAASPLLASCLFVFAGVFLVVLVVLFVAVGAFSDLLPLYVCVLCGRRRRCGGGCSGEVWWRRPLVVAVGSFIVEYCCG